MYQRLTDLLLKWLRVPPEPQPPHGDPASLRVFRAGRNFLNLRLLKWGVAQAGALAGIIFWFGFFSNLEPKVEEIRAQRQQARAAVSGPSAAAPQNIGDTINQAAKEFAEEHKQTKRSRKNRQGWGPADSFNAWQYGTANFLARLPRSAMLVIWFFEIAGIIVYVIQLPMTFMLARMDYDLRWYMVTDRSLRIRHGVWKINESTMSFANIQQVVVSQGPLQRLLGLGDVKVQSAGGGGEKEDHSGQEEMHHGLFHSVTNANEIRDLILSRLRRFRESGLGDPDEKSAAIAAQAPTPPADSGDLLAAAQELAAEARALRAAL
jgi:membrane protein YdbS with pleckstrin-like domain